MKFVVLLVLTIFSLSGCIAGKGDVKIDLKRKSKETSSSTIGSASVSSVQIINHQLVITGTGFSDVLKVEVDGNSLNEKFSIESKTATKIIANSIRAFAFDVSKVFNLILSDASASATFPIDFSLCNATLNGKGFDCAIAVSDKDVLSYDQATNKWKPRSINGLSYQGSWDANDPLPVTNTPGDYFIVGLANAPYGVGDWIVWNGSSFDQINNSTTITSVFGRTGAIVATEGDYDLNKLFDVDLSVAPTNGKVLKYNGTKWVASDDLSGGGAGSVTAAEIADGAVTDAKIVSVSAGKITGTLTSAQIADGAIVNADISGTAAIDYSKLNIPNTTIPYAKLNIADGDIPASKISGLSAATSVLAATIVDSDTTHAPDGNAVFDALGLKLNTTGGTLTIGTISGVPTPTNSDDVANKGYTDTRDALKLAKGGDTMSGVLTLDYDLKIKGGANYVTMKGHATSTTYDLVLPINKGISGYVLATDGNGNTSWVDVTTAVTTLDTDDVVEGTRLYFTEARVLGTDLAGLNTGIAGPIAATDTVLSAFGKMQYQVTDLKSKGQWEKSGSDIYYSVGDVQIDKKLKLQDSGTNYVQLKAPTTVTSTYTLTFPANDGDANQVLKTDGAGVLAWGDVTDASVQAFAKAALPACAAGEVLKSNGTIFSCVVDNSGAGAFSGTASKVVVTNAGGTLDVSATTSTELGYVSGVTSSIQTQLNSKEAAITAGTALQYLNGLKNFVTLDTLAVPENTRLYFTEPRVLSTDLSGFVASNTAITAADSVLSGLEKSQGQITNLNSIKANVAGDTFTGDVTLNTQLRLKDGAAGTYVILKAPASGTTTHTLTLPGTVGSSGQVLSMTGTAGVLAWTTPAASATPSGTAGGDLSGTYPNPTITALDATKVGTGVVDNTEFNYLNGVTSSIQTQLAGKQATDATLTALAGFNTNGIIVQTAADTFTSRSIAGTANRVIVTNGDGLAGNPLVNISTTLLPSPVVGDVGKFLKATAADTSVWTVLGSSDVTTALGFTPINKAGDSLTTGAFTLSGAAVLRSPDPIGLTDVANKQYVDGYGQWTKSGSDVYRSTGNVGVLTTTPATALDVNGVITKNGSVSKSLAYAVATATNVTINLPNGGTTLVDGYVYKFNLATQATATSTGAAYIVYQTGVGTWASKLVSSNGSISNHPSLQVSGSNVQIFHDHASTYTIAVLAEAIQTGNTTVISPHYFGLEGAITSNAGNVGIGISTPTDKLHVVGDVYVTGQVKSRGQLWREVLSIPDSTTTTNGYKIKTTIPVASKMVTLKIEGSHATYSDPILSYVSFYYYLGVVYAPKVFSIGSASALTNVKVGVENGYFTVFFSPVSYIAYMSVSILNTIGSYQNFPESNLTDWTYADEAATDPSYVAADTGMSFAGHMNILNNGSVGIGTTAPIAKLHVNGTDGRAITVSPGTTSQSLNFIHNDNGNINARYANINAALANGGSGYNYGHLSFSTAPDTTGNPATIERMRITGSGNVGIGTTAPAYKFQVGAAADGSEARANAWNSLSDERLKRDFEIIPESLEKILSLNGYYYYWNRGTDTSKKLGLKAQEVVKVFPEVVSHGADGFLSVSYNHLVAGVIEAVKEFFLKWQGDSKGLHREIASLRKENELLRRKNLETDARLRKLEQAILKKK